MHQSDWRDEQAAQHLPQPGDRPLAERAHARPPDARQPQARHRRHDRDVPRVAEHPRLALPRARAGGVGEGLAADHAQHRLVVCEHPRPARAALLVDEEQPAQLLLAYRLLQPSGLLDSQPTGGVPQARQGELGPRRRDLDLRGAQAGARRGEARAGGGHLPLRALPRRLQVGQGAHAARRLGPQGPLRAAARAPHLRMPTNREEDRPQSQLHLPDVQKPDAHGPQLHHARRPAHGGAAQQVDPAWRLPAHVQGLILA
mmetsp:Transcript_22861/g.57010  ORF Transcript_22861/g.57010 Transcript_22861/m.57010 type:complete len:258 (+) Transcript_22861:12520-13293(+)